MHYDKLDSEGWPLMDNTDTAIIRDAKSSASVHAYKFYISRTFTSPEEILSAGKWADEQCTDSWLVGFRWSGFMSETDAMHFKLRWC